jgi:membrane protein YdbS with pleckstrin-like domain
MTDIFVSEELKKEKTPHPRQTRHEPSSSESPIHEPKTKSEREHLPGHTHNPLSAYCYYPENVNFETREKEEKIVLLMRKHPITNLRWILISILMVLAPSLLGFFPFVESVPANFRLIGVLGWYLITTAFVLENFLTWFFNVYIVTDERIIDIDFHNLIYKEVSDAEIERIQDVTYKMGGVARTVFNYGDILVQTASEVPNFEFLAVPYPDRVVKILQDLRIEEKQEALEGRIR